MHSSPKRCDLLVIGGGPGGYVAAIKGSINGLSTFLVEENMVGGVCLHQGCIPTKSLIHSASTFYNMQSAERLGIKIKSLSYDFSIFQKRKNETISKLHSGIESLLASHGVKVIKGKASLTSDLVKIRGKEDLDVVPKKLILSTGSSSLALPAFPIDGEFIHDSTSILSIEKVPKSILIIGGGYIGCEFASLFYQLGSKVTIIESLPNIVMAQGATISNRLKEAFLSYGISIKSPYRVVKLIPSNGVTAILDDNSEVKAETSLISIGRIPKTDGLGLEKRGISIDTRGFVKVNELMETDIPGIYAIGDLTGKALLAHVASHQGIIAADNASGRSIKIDYNAIPSVIFTDPEIATIGRDLDSAKKEGFKALEAVFPYSFLGKCIATENTNGEAAIIYEKDSGRILGARVIGKGAESLIGEMALAISNELTTECVATTIHPHPTLSEIWMECAHVARGNPIHRSP